MDELDELVHLELQGLNLSLNLRLDPLHVLSLLAEALHSVAFHCGAPALLLRRVVLVVEDVLGDSFRKLRVSSFVCDWLLQAVL